MADGEIHYARFPVTLDSNAPIDVTPSVVLSTVFPDTEYDIVDSQIVPISGGSGLSNAVVVIVARRIT